LRAVRTQGVAAVRHRVFAVARFPAHVPGTTFNRITR
jgi:DNA-binding transcriptional regulator YbjK